MKRNKRINGFTRFSYACLFAAIGIGLFEVVFMVCAYMHMVD